MPYTIPSYTVSPGSVYQPKKSESAPILILDQISGAIAAWSTRRLTSTAPADIARGRDALTTEQDFTEAELAGTGFTDLAGAGDGFYVTLYDQIGSNNATQITAANQPKGVGTGALITDGDNPCLQFDGVNSFLSIPAAIKDLVTKNTSWTVACTITPNIPVLSYRVIWDSSRGAADRIQMTINNSGIVLCSIYDGSSFVNRSSTSLTDGQRVSCCLTHDSGTLNLYINGVSQSGTSGSATNATNVFTIGSSGGQPKFDGSMIDFIVFNRAITASEAAQVSSSLV